MHPHALFRFTYVVFTHTSTLWARITNTANMMEYMLKRFKRPLVFLLTLFIFNSYRTYFAYSYQSQDSTPDGNIPTIDVQMVAQKRWLVSTREFQNLQKELSYFIDKEIEKEKKRLIDKEDSKFHDMQNSFLKLVPNSRKKFASKSS